MLSKCANPGCPATFLYLHQGKLFRLDSSTEILVSHSGQRSDQAFASLRIFLAVRSMRRGADAGLQPREPESRLCL